MSSLSSVTQLLREGKLDDAARNCEELLKLQPQAAEPMRLMGVIALARRDGKSAVEHLMQAAALAPTNPQYLADLGTAHALNCRFDLAVEAFRGAIQLQSDCVTAWANLGPALKSLGHVSESIEAQQRAIQLYRSRNGGERELGIAHSNLGNVYREVGELEKAIVEYREALVLSPDRPGVHCNLGIALLANHQDQEALVAFREALKFDSNLPEAHLNLGVLLGEEGDLDAASKHFSQAAQRSESRPLWQFRELSVLPNYL